MSNNSPSYQDMLKVPIQLDLLTLIVLLLDLQWKLKESFRLLQDILLKGIRNAMIDDLKEAETFTC